MIAAQEKIGYNVLPDEIPRRAPARKPGRTPSGRIAAATCLVIAGFLLTALVISFYAQVFALGYQISRIQEDMARLRVEKDSLDSEVQKLLALGNIETLAVNKLGMVKPDAQNVLLVSIDAPVTGSPPAASGHAVNTADMQNGGAKNRLIQAFTDLVNQLGSRVGLGKNPEGLFLEGRHADDDQYRDPQKNYHYLSSGRAGLCIVDISPGLASAC